MNLKQKMLLSAAVIIVVPVAITAAIIGGGAISKGKTTLENQAQEKLISVRSSRQEQIESYVNTLVDQIKTFSNNRMTIDAMKSFQKDFPRFKEQTEFDFNKFNRSLRKYYTEDFVKEYESRNSGSAPDMYSNLAPLDRDSIALQYHYIAASPHPLGSKEELVRSNDNSAYSKSHGFYHPHIRDFLRTFGFYDIFLVDSESGDIVYSVFKELDFSTSLIDGPYAEAGIGRVFQAANQLQKRDAVIIDDYAPYLPSYQDQAMFLASPIFEGNKRVGVLIFQAPIDKINGIMTANKSWKKVGLGESGETYLVGPNYLMRNDSRFLIDDKNNYIDALKKASLDASTVSTIDVKNTSIGLQPVKTKGTQAALAGTTGFDIFDDYRGVSVLSAYGPINVQGLEWALMAEIDEAEAFSTSKELVQNVIVTSILVGVIVLVLGGAAAFFFVRKITGPVAELESTVKRVAEGDFKARAENLPDDELGELGGTLNKLLDDRISSLAETEQKNARLNDSVIELLKATEFLQNRDFTMGLPVNEDVTGPLADAVNETIEEISEVLQEVLDVAQQVEGSSKSVKFQSDAVSEVAAIERGELETAIKQLTDASVAMKQIAELSRSCNVLADGTSATTKEAFDAVNNTVKGLDEIRVTIHETEKRIKRLGDRSQEINKIVNIIDNVAERTHTLALNASLQAIAAGEEGKGFAVIADEVQHLAKSAREATSQISSIVENIQVEAQGTTETMSKAVTDVVEGSRVAEIAGERMNKTQQVAAEMADAVKQIASYSEAQEKVSDELKERTQTLQDRANETHEKLEEQGEQTNQLMDSAKQLLDAVKVFKLPNQSANADDINRVA